MSTNNFHWGAINDQQFEQIIYQVFIAQNPRDIVWRSGTGGRGRDIEAEIPVSDVFSRLIFRKCYAEIKHYSAGVSPEALAPAFSWISSNEPDIFFIIVSSHLTNPCRDYIENWRRNLRKALVEIWERKNVEDKILSTHEARQEAVKCGLLSPDISEILPDNPDDFRRSLIFALPVEYRYWIELSDIDLIDDVCNVLEKLSDFIVSYCSSSNEDAYRWVAISIPNSQIRMALLKEQIKLQILIRDYLVKAINQESETKDLVEDIKSQISTLGEIGNQSGDFTLARPAIPPW